MMCMTFWRVFIKLHFIVTRLISLDTSSTGRGARWASPGGLWESLYWAKLTFVNIPFQHKIDTIFGSPILIFRPTLAINLNAIHNAGHVAVPPSWIEPSGSMLSSWLSALLEQSHVALHLTRCSPRWVCAYLYTQEHL